MIARIIKIGRNAFVNELQSQHAFLKQDFLPVFSHFIASREGHVPAISVLQSVSGQDIFFSSYIYFLNLINQ